MDDCDGRIPAQELCPFINADDSRCARRLSLSQLDQAFETCLHGHTTCKTYYQLAWENRDGDANPNHHAQSSAQSQTQTPGSQPPGLPRPAFRQRIDPRPVVVGRLHDRPLALTLRGQSLKQFLDHHSGPPSQRRKPGPHENRTPSHVNGEAIATSARSGGGADGGGQAVSLRPTGS